MDSVLEGQRRGHEELERLEIAMVNELANPAKGPREKITQDHRLLTLVNRYHERSQGLLGIYDDASGARKQEIDALSGPNEFTEFYNRLKLVKEFHRRFPNEVADPMELEFIQLEKAREEGLDKLETMFTGEEAYGKFLDLNEAYNFYVGLKGVNPVSYMSYLDDYDRFVRIPPSTKALPDYHRYLETLHGYLVSFVERAQPLLDIEQALAGRLTSFDADWSAGAVRGWEPSFSDPDQDRRLFCIACGKQFAKQSVFDAHLTGKKHIKAAEKLLSEGQTDVNPDMVEAALKKQEEEKRAGHRELARLEVRIAALSELLQAVRWAIRCCKKSVRHEGLSRLGLGIPNVRVFSEDTKANVERKQSRTVEEREEDMEQAAEDLSEDEDEDDDEEKPLYNPLNLPLGFDGKPIPYWLYRLHGLSKSYECQICDEKYRGRKAFERHFTEWKHANMLRKLGIPNTVHFQDVTTFDDAIALWDKLKKEKQTVEFKAEQEEEYEDSAGNVLSRKTYEDLRRQGLL